MTPSNGLRTAFERPTRTLFSRVRRVGPPKSPATRWLLRKTTTFERGFERYVRTPPIPPKGFRPVGGLVPPWAHPFPGGLFSFFQKIEELT